MNAPAKHIVLLGIGHTNAHIVKEWASDPIPGCTLTCISKFPTATYSGTLKSFSPQSDFLKILNTGDGKALLQYRWITAHARWCWKLKTWIDKRFVRELQVTGKSAGNVQGT